jgi:hypothetical protein
MVRPQTLNQAPKDELLESEETLLESLAAVPIAKKDSVRVTKRSLVRDTFRHLHWELLVLTIGVQEK